MASPFREELVSILRQRCPRCREGNIFHGQTAMNERCPVCGLKFRREQGYFLGALYVSYALALVILGFLLWIGSSLLPDWDLGNVVLLAGVVYLPLVPVVFRLSRVIWIHFDRWAWPGPS